MIDGRTKDALARYLAREGEINIEGQWADDGTEAVGEICTDEDDGRLFFVTDANVSSNEYDENDEESIFRAARQILSHHLKGWGTVERAGDGRNMEPVEELVKYEEAINKKKTL